MITLACSCKHEYQDQEHGRGIRVHNWARQELGGNGGWRCTVCSSVKAAKPAKSTEEKPPGAKTRVPDTA